MTYQQSCKKCLTVIDKNHQIIMKALEGSKTLRHLDTSLLQKRVVDLQASSQVTIALVSFNEVGGVVANKLGLASNYPRDNHDNLY